MNIRLIFFMTILVVITVLFCIVLISLILLFTMQFAEHSDFAFIIAINLYSEALFFFSSSLLQ